MIKRFGNAVRAWYLGLDPAGAGRLDWKAFRRACASPAVCWSAQIETLFEALKDRDGYAAFEVFAPLEARAIKSLQKHLLRKYGSIPSAWDAAFAPHADSD